MLKCSACLMIVLLATTGLAATNYVAKTGDDGTGTGTSGNPWLTIQFAVTNAAAANGDEIRVGTGTYTENLVVSVNSSLTIKGGFNPSGWSWDPTNYPTIIKASNPAGDVVDFNTSLNALIGFIVTGGRYGIYCRYGGGLAQTVTHCIVTNNTSSGIRVEQSGSKTALIARNCLIANNGDGIYINVDNASVNTYIDNCTIVDNAGDGYSDVHNWHKRHT